jgi:hypothetical protein
MTDAGTCFISGSNYDTSCTVDSDCVRAVQIDGTWYPVLFDDWCVTHCFCEQADAINKASVPQYAKDILGTPLGSGPPPPCPCQTPAPGPCCVEGQCVAAASCSGPISWTPIDAGAIDAPDDLDVPVLCVADAGPDPAAPSTTPALPGVSRWCVEGQVCASLNGAWDCCVQGGCFSP